jgi:mRNA interferase RelE/StbE
LAWRIDFSPEAEKQLASIDRPFAKRIVAYLREKVAISEDPRSLGKPLKGVLREFWRYRVGDYRIVTRIEDDRVLVLVVRIAHRREAYRGGI